MHRLYYYLSFTLLYIVFSYIMIWLSPQKANKGGIFKIIFIGLILVVVSSIRMNTGSDYWSYSMIYNRSLDYFSLDEVYADRGNSPGFYMLSFLLKEYTLSIGWDSLLEKNLIFIVTAVFTTVCTFHLVIRNSSNFKWSMWVFFLMGYFMMGNNILKQIFAMIFILYAYDYLFQKKYILYVMMCILAVLFHVTAIVPAFILPFAKRFSLTLALPLCLIFAILVPVIGNVANASLFGYVKYFKNFSVYSEANIGRIYSIGSLIAYTALYMTIRKHSKAINRESEKTYSYINLIAIGIAINIIAFNFWLLLRVSLYFYQFSLFLIPNVITIVRPSRQKVKTIKTWFVIFAIFYVLYSMDNHYFAYHTIFNERMQPAHLYDYVEIYEK